MIWPKYLSTSTLGFLFIIYFSTLFYFLKRKNISTQFDLESNSWKLLNHLDISLDFRPCHCLVIPTGYGSEWLFFNCLTPDVVLWVLLLISWAQSVVTTTLSCKLQCVCQLIIFYAKYNPQIIYAVWGEPNQMVDLCDVTEARPISE